MLKDLLGRRSKDKRGFTLIEVMLTLSFLASILFLLSRQQNIALELLNQNSGVIDRFFLVRKRLYGDFSASPKKATGKKTWKEKVEHPEMVISIETKEISKKSSLAQFEEFFFLEAVKGTWREGFRERSVGFVGLSLKERDEKE